MTSNALSPDQYIEELPEDRKQVFKALRHTILENLPPGFEEQMGYGMIGYVVPHSIYPAGYHCAPDQSLPFMGMASQKNFIAVYHMGMYAHKPLIDWFLEEYPDYSKRKPDMGKSCIRFKKMSEIPVKLIGELASKMTVDEWIGVYEQNLKK